MICMLRYKGLDRIKERMNYLKLDLDAKTLIEFEKLTTGGREKENTESKESVESGRTDAQQPRAQRMNKDLLD